jgi:hypothetical protein
MKFEADETARVKILMAGDELSLEEKINEFIEEHPDWTLASLDVEQVEYHARTGSVDFGLIGVIVMRVKKGAVA